MTSFSQCRFLERKFSSRAIVVLLVLAALMSTVTPTLGQEESPGIEVRVMGGEDSGAGSTAIRLVLLLTLLSVAPSILLMMTCFVRIVIAFHFLRIAMGTQQMPPNQVIIGLSLFLSLFVMSPVIDQIREDAWTKYEAGEVDAIEGAKLASGPLREFMLKNTRSSDLKLFVTMSKIPKPEGPQDLPMRVVVPAFLISEIRSGFEIGFLLFLPFLVVDLVVAATLLSMGMMMLPPAMVSLPFKVLLFVLVDGWGLLAGSLVKGFQ